MPIQTYVEDGQLVGFLPGTGHSVRIPLREIVEGARCQLSGAELAALISSRCFADLKAPVERVTGFDVPTPAGDLEDEFIPNVDRILFGVQRVLEYRRP